MVVRDQRGFPLANTALQRKRGAMATAVKAAVWSGFMQSCKYLSFSVV